MIEIFNDKAYFNGGVAFAILPDVDVTTIVSATPTISNASVFKIGSGAIAITQFIGGAQGQTIKILGNGTTSITHNTSYICTNTGANKTLVANKIYTFTLIDSVWYEDA